MKKITLYTISILFLLLSSLAYAQSNDISAQIIEKTEGGRVLLFIDDLNSIQIDDMFSIYDHNNQYIGYGRITKIREDDRFNAIFQQLTGWDLFDGYSLSEQYRSNLDFGFKFGNSYLTIGKSDAKRVLTIFNATLTVKYSIADLLNISQLFALFEYSYGESWKSYPYIVQSPSNSKFDPGYQSYYLGLSKHWKFYETHSLFFNFLVGNVEYNIYSFYNNTNHQRKGYSFKPNFGYSYMIKQNINANFDLYYRPNSYGKVQPKVESDYGFNLGVTYALVKDVPESRKINLLGDQNLYTQRTPRRPETQTTNITSNRNQEPVPQRQVDYGHLEDVFSMAVLNAFIDIAPSSKISIVQFTANNTALRDFVIGELEHDLRANNYVVIASSGHGNLDHTTTIDDRSAINIGSSDGADYVVLGSIDGVGSFRRLRLRVLNVQTGVVVGTASEPF